MKALTLPMILKTLEKIYTPPRTFLDWETPLDLLVATILSAQCTDVRVNIVTKTLFARCRTAEDYVKISREELETIIHSCGTYHAKAKYLQTMCQMLLDHHDGKVPDTMEDLVTLPGVGRKTASIILWAVFGKNEGLAVDTHVIRLAQRLGLTRHKDPKKIELDLTRGLPREQWGKVTTLLISHGRAVCTAHNRKCEECVFQNECPSSSARHLPDLAKVRSRESR
jgi:endonuclease-3